MIFIDMWYDNAAAEADNVDIFFNDCNLRYEGNIYKDGQAIGDFTADSAQELEKAFPQFVFNWN